MCIQRQGKASWDALVWLILSRRDYPFAEQGDYNLVRPKVNAVYLINCLSLWESVTNMYPDHHPLPSLDMPLSFNIRCDYGDS